MGLLLVLVMDVAGTAAIQGQSDLFTVGPLVWAMTLAASLSALVVLYHRPRHRLGWLLLAQGPLVSLVLWADSYLRYGWIDHPGALPGLGWVALWSNNCWPLFFLLPATIGYLFPDGRPMSPRWKRWQLVTSLAYPLAVVGGFFDGRPFAAPFTDIPTPVPIAPSWFDGVLHGVAIPLLLAHLAGAALSARTRFRNARGTPRLQLLWFAWAATLVPAVLLLCFLDRALNGAATGLTVTGIAVAGTLLPTAIGIAIVRHQLFDIEVIISKTLLYGALAAVIAGVYAACVYGVGTAAGYRGIAGFVAVVLIAIVIEPLRAALRHRVEHWVWGDRADPYRALTRLGGQLQQTLAPTEVLSIIVTVVREALRLHYVAIALTGPDGLRVAASAGQPTARPRRDVALTYQGEPMGVLSVEGELSDPDERLLVDLSRHAGVAIHAVRLTMDLQHSRERILTVREEERLRLRRDLHDGLGPELASIVMRLDGARHLATNADLAELLSELTAQTRAAVDDIRRLVEGLRPPALDEVGLLDALRQQAVRLSEGSVLIDVRGRQPVTQLPAAVEVAAYRIAVEAMTNVVRHAQARHCVVEVTLNGHLEVSVHDNGCGVPPSPRKGIGLASMRERAAELGGTCTVSARPGGGTRVHATLPVAQ